MIILRNTLVSDDFGLRFELWDEFVNRPHDNTTLSLCGHFNLLYFESRLKVNTQVSKAQCLNRLFLSLNNALHICETRSIQAQVTCEDCGKGHSDFLKTEVNLSCHFCGFPIISEFDFRAECSRGDSHESSQDLSSLIVIVIDWLFSEHSQIKGLFHHDLSEDFGHC